MNDEQKEMMSAHDALDDGVYLVAIFDKETLKQQAVFTTFAKAKEWIDTFPHNLSCLCAPFVLDAPELGNSHKKDMQ